MKILISGTELNVKDCFARELASGARFLHITFLQSVINYDTLKEILAANTGEIILTKDNGVTQTFSGYAFTPEIVDKTDETGAAVFSVTVKCVAEAERQALEAKAEAVALRKLATDQAETINNLTAALENLKQQLLVVQLAAADLYEKNLAAESTEETTEEEAEELTEQEVQ